MRRNGKLPPTVYNWTSLSGAMVALVSALAIIFLLLIDTFIKRLGPYTGIILYILLPLALVIGLLIIPLGMYLKWRSAKRMGKVTFHWPFLDLNLPRHRRALSIFVSGTVLFVVLSSVGVYRTYEFTESVSFCGLVCHRVMEPEYVTYRNSPHARLECVNCHIGPGAGWYVESKLSGLYQVYATIFDKFPRPIPTPIKDLRPVQAACEQCHWPPAFRGLREKLFVHYMQDARNTYWPVNLLLKTGGARPGTALENGIHWHVNPAVRVEYFATDKKIQEIPWVRLSDSRTGRTVIYRAVSDGAGKMEKPLSRGGEQFIGGLRLLDCVDCHNSPSHVFHSPEHALDSLISAGFINSSLPEIKQAALKALSADYASRAAALGGISNSIRGYYSSSHPDVYTGKRTEIERAIKAVQTAYSGNIFPYMRAKWTEYPDNVGHLISPGCMRCHDGKHVSADGRRIENACTTCHIIIAQGPGAPATAGEGLAAGLEFRHPVDIADAWKDGLCFNCHTGAGF